MSLSGDINLTKLLAYFALLLKGGSLQKMLLTEIWITTKIVSCDEDNAYISIIFIKTFKRKNNNLPLFLFLQN